MAVTTTPTFDTYPAKEVSGDHRLTAVADGTGAIALHEATTSAVPLEAYHKSPEEMDALEADLFAEIAGQVPDRPIAVVIVPNQSRFADFGRTSETQVYKGYDNHAAMAPYEQQSFFLYTYDVKTGTVAHVKRIVRAKTPEEAGNSGLTGIEIFDDRTMARPGSDEHADIEEIMSIHGIKDLSKVWNVAANHVMRRQGGRTGLPYTESSYLALFRLTRDHDIHSIIAYVNDDARQSLFDRAGLEYSLLGGQEYHLPEDPSDHHNTVYDLHYTAVCIQDTPHNLEVFGAIPLFMPDADAKILEAR